MRHRVDGGRPLPAAGFHLARERFSSRSLRPITGIDLLTATRPGLEPKSAHPLIPARHVRERAHGRLTL